MISEYEPSVIKVLAMLVIAEVLGYKVEDILLQANIPYDLLVGADGAGSAVRTALQQIMPANYIQRYRHKQVYSMTQVTPADPARIPPHVLFHAHSAKVGNLLAALAVAFVNVHQLCVIHASSSSSTTLA